MQFKSTPLGTHYRVIANQRALVWQSLAEYLDYVLAN